MTVPNFCKPGIMSTCTSGEKWKEHNRCYFAEKSTDLNRCMFYMFDQYCDCIKAQQADFNPIDQKPIVFEMPKVVVQTPKSTTPIDVTKVQVRKICPIDFSTICSKSFCSQWNWCKDPFKNK